jgi:hypothetical protein
MKKKANNFSLLEVMIGLSLLILTTGAMGLKMYHLVDEKKFYSKLDALKMQLMTCYHLSVSTQSDWKGLFSKKEDRWIFQASCDEGRALKPIELPSMNIFFNGEPRNIFCIDFFSSGIILPQGKVEFCRDQYKPSLDKETWILPSIFAVEQGSENTPSHPVHRKNT